MSVPRRWLCGRIYWLPPHAQVQRGSQYGMDRITLTADCYDHPVVVISAKPKKGYVEVLKMTGLAARDPRDSNAPDPGTRTGQGPDEPDPDDHACYIYVELENGILSMRQKANVKVDAKYSVPVDVLRTFLFNLDEPEYFLTRESYNAVRHSHYMKKFPGNKGCCSIM